MPLKVRDVIRLLEKHDWHHVRTSGDHRIYRGPEGRVTVVSGKLGDDVRPGTWRAILGKLVLRSRRNEAHVLARD